jgi:putative redox protein
MGDTDMAGSSSTVDLEWKGGLKFISTDAYGHTLTVNAPEENGDEYEGSKPGEMMLTSLAGCSGIDVVGILRKQRQDVSAIDIKVTGTQEPNPPWTWIKVHLQYVLRGRGLDRKRVEHAIDLSENSYCSVGATLGGRCVVTSEFRIVEDAD